MKFSVMIGREVPEYATVTVEAESAEAAEEQVAHVLARGEGEAYLQLVNGVSWEPGDQVFDERVVSVEASEEASDGV